MLRFLIVLCLLGQIQARAADAAGLDPQRTYQTSQGVIGSTIGDHTLLDRASKPVRLSAYRGKPLLVSFIYTGCFQTCPGDTLSIAKAVGATQDLLGSDTFNIVSIGFNVPFDSPEAMAAFSKQRGIIARRWEFLSPETTDIAALTREFGFSYMATPKGFDHLTQLTILDRDGRVFRQLYSENLNAQAIIATLRDIDNGTVPVAQGWSGVLTRIRLLCSVYDRDSGTYRADYSLIVGLLVGASILGSVLYLLAGEWLRQRPKAR